MSSTPWFREGWTNCPRQIQSWFGSEAESRVKLQNLSIRKGCLVQLHPRGASHSKLTSSQSSGLLLEAWAHPLRSMVQKNAENSTWGWLGCPPHWRSKLARRARSCGHQEQTRNKMFSLYIQPCLERQAVPGGRWKARFLPSCFLLSSQAKAEKPPSWNPISMPFYSSTPCMSLQLPSTHTASTHDKGLFFDPAGKPYSSG